MLIWLASWQRSGNTLVRMLLKRVWQAPTFSTYDDMDDIGAEQKLKEQVGHEFLGRPWPQAYEDMKASDELFFVKTHDNPIDANKAIYIVRDGRSACRSYAHYSRDFDTGSGAPAPGLTDVILGFTPFNSWSDHLDAWDPHNRRDTLVMKYEDMLRDPQRQIEQIAAFVGRPPIHSWRNDFAELHKLNPKFFRAGAENRADDALGEGESRLFWLLHGPWMRRLNYVSSEFEFPALPHAEIVRHTLREANGMFRAATRSAETFRLEAKARQERLEAELTDERRRNAELTADLELAQGRIEAMEEQLQRLGRSRVLRVARAVHLTRHPGRIEELVSRR